MYSKNDMYYNELKQALKQTLLDYKKGFLSETELQTEVDYLENEMLNIEVESGTY